MVKIEENPNLISTDTATPEMVCPPTIPALPMVDDDTLDKFLMEPNKVERLPVKPQEYRREFQRMIVSAFLHNDGQSASAA
jgi:hypothetical protein